MKELKQRLDQAIIIKDGTKCISSQDAVELSLIYYNIAFQRKWPVVVGDFESLNNYIDESKDLLNISFRLVEAIPFDVDARFKLPSIGGPDPYRRRESFGIIHETKDFLINQINLAESQKITIEQNNISEKTLKTSKNTLWATVAGSSIAFITLIIVIIQR